MRTHVECRHLVWTDFGWCSAAYPPSLPDGPDHEEGPVTSGARAADLAFNVEFVAEPTAIRRSRCAPAAKGDDISDSCNFCSGLVQHRDLSVAQRSEEHTSELQSLR